MMDMEFSLAKKSETFITKPPIPIFIWSRNCEARFQRK